MGLSTDLSLLVRLKRVDPRHDLHSVYIIVAVGLITVEHAHTFWDHYSLGKTFEYLQSIYIALCFKSYQKDAWSFHFT